MKELRKYYRIKGTSEEIYAALINPFAITLRPVRHYTKIELPREVNLSTFLLST